MKRRGQDDEVNVSAKGQPTTGTHPNPFVSIERMPEIEAAATALSLKNIQFISKASSKNGLSCWLCGEDTLTLLTSLSQGRRHYFKQVELFQGYLNGRDQDDGEVMGDDMAVETCAKCLQEVKRVWELNQEILAIQEDISKIIDRVAASMPKPKASKKEKQKGQVTNGLKCADGTRMSVSVSTLHPEVDPENEINLSNPIGPAHPESNPVSENEDQISDMNSINVEIKEDIPWSEGEESNLNIPEDESFEMMANNPQQGQQDLVPSDSEQNTVGQVNPESELPLPTGTHSSSNSDSLLLRPKRKSRLAADDILRRTASSAVNQDKSLSNDEDVENAGNEMNPDPATSSNSESDSDFDPSDSDDTNQGRPPEKKRHKPNKEDGVYVTNQKTLCDLCGISMRPKSLKRHIARIHEGVRNLDCPHCEKRFFTKYNRSCHIATVHDAASAKHACSNCGQKFRFLYKLRLHKARVHPKRHGDHAGNEMDPDQPFPQESQLSNHSTLPVDPTLRQKAAAKRSAYRTKVRPLSCSLCHPIRRFLHALSLTRHNLEMHPELDNNPEGVPTTVKINDLKPLCDLCGVSVHPNYLRGHTARVHDGVRNFACTQCDKRFFSSNDLSRHVSRVHEGKKKQYPPGKHPCSDCGQEYKSQYNLHHHRVRDHEGASKRHGCDKCPMKFYKRDDLRRHITRHLEIKWWCGDCGKNFKSARHLQIHQGKLDGKVRNPKHLARVRVKKCKGRKGAEMDDPNGCGRGGEVIVESLEAQEVPGGSV